MGVRCDGPACVGRQGEAGRAGTRAYLPSWSLLTVSL
jgi:hypothetical protein